ncbi:restriction endonuclease subunit S [Haloplanus aerogenes]|uniref:Type I restriction enzyme S subunit n=2 Tax=Haloplanus aerogenes TaxID=660522 RepID=A0A3M0CHH3_9EURY|nr:restriction endonuclease subunit S [Haloplanus aerogenes]RMB08295.1 type I restriction enzyme S subunit [Haloplanus aerogenes]
MSDQYDLEQFASADSGDERRSEEEEPTESSPEDHGTARFPSLPTDWEIKRLDEVATVQGGSTPSTDKDEYWGGDIPWATPTDLTELQGNTISDTEDKITEAGLESTSTHVLPPYSVLLTSRASIGKCAVNTVPMATNQGFQSLIPGEEVNTWYLYYVITEMAPYLESLGAGSTFSEISKREVQRVQIPVPPMEEQLRIAGILYDTDQGIFNTQSMLDEQEVIRKGVVREVLTEGTREHQDFTEKQFGSIPSDWPVVRLGEVLTDSRYGTDEKSHSDGEGYPTLRIPNVVQRRITEDDIKYTELSDSAVEKLALQEGDLLIVRTNGNPDYAGRCAVFEERDETYVFASYLIRLRFDEDRVHPKYVREFLNSSLGRVEMNGWIRTSAGNYNLSIGGIEKIEIPLPPLEEQREIVEIVETLDENQESTREYKNRISNLKEGISRRLVSGDVRIHSEVDIPDEVRVDV